MSEARTPSIEVKGEMHKLRQRVDIDGLPVYLTRTSFRYLLRLIWALRTCPGGWIARKDFDAGTRQTQSLADLRREIDMAYTEAGRELPEWRVFESDAFKRVRLMADPKQITIDPAVESLPDGELQKMVGQIRRKEKRDESHNQSQRERVDHGIDG